MPQMEGVVTVAQEARFQLTDDAGISHLFLLSYGAGAEPEQLTLLQKRQARVRVDYFGPRNVLALVARSIVLTDAPAHQRT